MILHMYFVVSIQVGLIKIEALVVINNLRDWYLISKDVCRCTIQPIEELSATSKLKEQVYCLQESLSQVPLIYSNEH